LIIKSGQVIVDESLEVLLKSDNDDQSQKLTLEEVFVKHHSEYVKDHHG